ncbi:hemolysin B [Neisseria meningitidis 93004]|nr:hemolysin B [Neisseria meningitidis 93004]
MYIPLPTVIAIQSNIMAIVSTPHPALSALIILAHYHGIAAKSLGLKAKVVRQPVKRLAMVTLPALVWCDDGNHFKEKWLSSAF